MKKTLVDLGVSSNKISVVYNWNDDLKVYNPKENSSLIENFIATYKIDLDKFNIVYAGNIGLFQGVEKILSIADEYKNDNDIVFYIIGDGAKKEYILKQIVENNISNIFYIPYQDGNIVKFLYSFGDVNLITLKENILRTALPSKLPVTLTYSNPIIFASDTDSDFANELKLCQDCYVVDINNLKSISKSIDLIRNNNKNGFKYTRKSFNEKYFSRRNIKVFVDYILK